MIARVFFFWGGGWQRELFEHHNRRVCSAIQSVRCPRSQIKEKRTGLQYPNLIERELIQSLFKVTLGMYQILFGKW